MHLHSALLIREPAFSIVCMYVLYVSMHAVLSPQ